MRLSLKPFLPRSLFGRAALILIVPTVAIQLIVSIAFIQRHFEGVTRQLVHGVVMELALLREAVDGSSSIESALATVQPLAEAVEMVVELPAVSIAAQDTRDWADLTARPVIAELRERLPNVLSVDLASVKGRVLLTEATRFGPMQVSLPRGRVSASNPHQLLVIMMLASILMTLIAFMFLRNQLRPIKRLAEAAEAFGKGEAVPYRPRGALEVRAAGGAFLDMRARIERAIETRTLMLSGVSHDLRTPITRLRLGLSMLPEDEEVQALLSDVREMERLVDEFLAFARGDAMEEPVEADPAQIAARIVDNAARSGRSLAWESRLSGPITLRLRPQAVQRAVENLLGNAQRHGDQVRLTLSATERTVRFVVEDNGPGIPEAQREAAMAPFARLGGARDPNQGGGVGLGLSIAADVARSHGGRLLLGRSDSLGGLRAELVLAR
ncbi:MAG: ATP-binding protein [Pseudotabrizicola sp.]|uniref:ATP-binding protein n=1 Tax=Pseudotabrizicola sp. TaxID=2939647 RepID=UPI002719B23F|nr:ATP-binding protein [Pseudotabrizicola sp.]MDO8884235.1 ATP-binding protein [Pseudotabrizicola sp.]MDP2083005.1 ATP-binding protein [Pseudotabrizicola sp.]MDZ7572423.1 ATP-binding protein [Pseudotabrizicola sp.]